MSRLVTSLIKRRSKFSSNLLEYFSFNSKSHNSLPLSFQYLHLNEETEPLMRGTKRYSSFLGYLNEEQLEYQGLAQSFALNELLPNAAEWDEKKHFPREVLQKAAQLGFSGLFCGEDVGGSNLGRFNASIIFEELSYADVSTTAYLTIHNMNSSIIDKFGNDKQRKHWLPSLITMELFSSYCLTEPHSGSDAASLQTSARQAAGSTDFILNGAKAFISGGGVSDLYLVMARTSGHGPSGITCFVVEKNSSGISFGKQEKKMGWNSQPTAAVMFDEVRVPAENVIGEVGQGFKIAMAGLDGGRVNIGACSVGGARFCLERSLEYTSNRKQFCKKLVDFQNTKFKLADMATSLEASRLMVRNAAWALDGKSPSSSSAAAMAKRFSTDTCYDIANQALQLFGGYGYLKDYQIERYVRDLRVHTILEGTNEIMRVIIAKHLLKDFQ